MKKEQIEEAYKIAEEYFENNNAYKVYYEELSKDLIQIGAQMALQGEVLFDENNSLIRIE